MISASGSSLLALIAHASKGAIETSTGMSLLLAIFHASFDAAINQLADHVTHGSNTTRFLNLQRRHCAPAIAVITATRGQLGRPRATSSQGRAGDR